MHARGLPPIYNALPGSTRRIIYLNLIKHNKHFKPLMNRKEEFSIFYSEIKKEKWALIKGRSYY